MVPGKAKANTRAPTDAPRSVPTHVPSNANPSPSPAPPLTSPVSAAPAVQTAPHAQRSPPQRVTMPGGGTVTRQTAQHSYGTGDTGGHDSRFAERAVPAAATDDSTAHTTSASDQTPAPLLYTGFGGAPSTDDPELGGGVYGRVVATEDDFTTHIDEVIYGVNVDNRDIRTRHAFVRKVHGIVALQMAVAIGLMCVTLYADAMNEYFASRSDMSYLGLVLGLVVVLPGLCFTAIRDVSPWNGGILILLTIVQAFMFAIAAAYYHSEATLQGVSIVALSFLLFVFFTFQTKYDFRGWLPYAVPLVCGGVVFGVGRLIWPSVRNTDAAWAAVISAVVTELFVYNTQLLCYRLTPTQVVAATLSLYFDLPNLVLHLLNTATRHTRAS